jgi:hypothetical protein
LPGSRNKEHPGRYREAGEWRFSSRASIDAWGRRRGGYAVLHRPTPMFDPMLYFTWHRTRKGAMAEFHRIRNVAGGWVADECIIELKKETRPARVR